MKTLTTIMAGLLSAALWCGGCINKVMPTGNNFYWYGSYSQDIDRDGVEDEVRIEFCIKEKWRSKETWIDLGRNGVVNYNREIGYDFRTKMPSNFLRLYDEQGREIPYRFPNFAPFMKYMIIDDDGFISQ